MFTKPTEVTGIMYQTCVFVPNDDSRLCSEHFEEHWQSKTRTKCKLIEGALPTIFDLPKHLQVRTQLYY